MKHYEIITDGRTLRHFSRVYGLVFDKTFKYCTGDTGNGNNNPFILMYRNGKKTEDGDAYALRYIDGCFYPFLCKLSSD